MSNGTRLNRTFLIGSKDDDVPALLGSLAWLGLDAAVCFLVGFSILDLLLVVF